MKTLVTGATGLVGSQLVDQLLERNAPVRALVRDQDKATALRQRGVETMLGDVRDRASLIAALDGIEVVQHCAAAVGHHFSKKEIYQTNLGGVRNLLEGAQKAGTGRVVLVSSVNVLGTRNLDPATEDLPCRRSRDPSADVKIEVEDLAQQYASAGLEMVIVRPGFIYGPGDRRNLPQLVSAIRRGKFSFLGSRNNVVPIVHVEDVAQALILAGTVPAARGRTYHITDGTRTTIGDIVAHLAGLLGCPVPQRVLPYFIPRLACVVFEIMGRWRKRRRPAPITRAGLRFLGTSRFVDIGRARSELGYQPHIFFREGMAATLDWMHQNLEEAVHASSAGN